MGLTGLKLNRIQSNCSVLCDLDGELFRSNGERGDARDDKLIDLER